VPGAEEEEEQMWRFGEVVEVDRVEVEGPSAGDSRIWATATAMAIMAMATNYIYIYDTIPTTIKGTYT
jgi:hypothetical protein